MTGKFTLMDKIIFRSAAAALFAFTALGSSAQTQPPPPSAPKAVTVPAVKESKLKNGLTLAVIEKHEVPLVTIQLLVKAGAGDEDPAKAGLANLTADLLTKGTKTRTATQIAEEIAFLGGSINTGAGWNNSVVSVTVTADKVDQALAIMSDVVLEPKFDQKELDLLKSQTLDELKYNLKQPTFVANYVASRYSFGEHPAGGTLASIDSITAADVSNYYAANYRPKVSVLIFTGDIDAKKAAISAEKAFGSWAAGSNRASRKAMISAGKSLNSDPAVRRLLVIDLPNSGQAAVTYANVAGSTGRNSKDFYSASVLNSILGGGYSSRLNQEIRIKRGLSYGAGSAFGWRNDLSNFSTRTQTKNPSAAEVAELVMVEIKRLGTSSVASDELVPRQSVLTGGFGRNLETTSGLAAAVGDLYSFGIPASELNSYVSSVNGVNDAQIRKFAEDNFRNGDLIIVGDYSIFKDDLAKRFPGMKVDVIKADDLDLSKENLRK